MKRFGMDMMVVLCLASCTSGAGQGSGTGGKTTPGTGGGAVSGSDGTGATGGNGSGGSNSSGGTTSSGGAGGASGGSNAGGSGGSVDAGSDRTNMGGPDGSGSDAGSADVNVSVGDGSASGWWDGAWTKRRKITITDTQLKEEQTDFQLPIRLDATTFDYASAASGGKDLRIVDSTGKILNHQIDTWDTAGTSLLWLRLPKLTTVATVVWLYYGNAAAAAPTDADMHAVWPAPYAGVWHLSGDSKDATPHGFDGMTTVGGSYVAAKEGRGFKLNGAQKDHIDLKQNIKLVAGAAGCTFSAWINPTNIEDTVNGMVIMTLGKWVTNNHNSYADFNVNADGQMISHVDPGDSTTAGGYTRVNSDSGIIKANEWVWVTYVIDLAGSQERFYKNGVLASTKNATFLAKSFIDMVSSRTVIGTEEDNIDHWYTGTMDELRLETGMRSANWIGAQYRSLTVAGFVKVDSAESKP